MAAFQAPFVPELPRFTGGAVGFLSYDRSAWLEPVLQNALARLPASGEDDGAFMLFDTVLAFDHVPSIGSWSSPTRGSLLTSRWRRCTGSRARRSRSWSGSLVGRCRRPSRITVRDPVSVPT
jgi:hypothetical protein